MGILKKLNWFKFDLCYAIQCWYRKKKYFFWISHIPKGQVWVDISILVSKSCLTIEIKWIQSAVLCVIYDKERTLENSTQISCWKIKIKIVHSGAFLFDWLKALCLPHSGGGETSQKVSLNFLMTNLNSNDPTVRDFWII